MDMTSGEMAEYKKEDQLSISDAQIPEPKFAPTISVTAPDDEMVKILTQKLDLGVAEVLGKCQLKWGDDRIKRDLSSVLTQINSVPQPFIP